jgi:hypothetical protein
MPKATRNKEIADFTYGFHAQLVKVAKQERIRSGFVLMDKPCDWRLQFSNIQSNITFETNWKVPGRPEFGKVNLRVAFTVFQTQKKKVTISSSWRISYYMDTEWIVNAAEGIGGVSIHGTDDAHVHGLTVQVSDDDATKGLRKIDTPDKFRTLLRKVAEMCYKLKHGNVEDKTMKHHVEIADLCDECNEPQVSTGSGPVCINGHGGAPSHPGKCRDFDFVQKFVHHRAFKRQGSECEKCFGYGDEFYTDKNGLMNARTCGCGWEDLQ